MSPLLIVFILFVPAAPSPVTWQVDPLKPTHPGARLQLTLTGRLTPGWHLYALEEPSGGPIPTTIALTEGDPAELTGVTESKPGTARDPAFDAPTSFFDSTAAFHLRITLAKSALQNGSALQDESTLHILVRYQSCNGSLCLAPRTDTIPVKLSLKP